MEILRIYKCLCDIQRLRILNLLKQGPLCVCHLMQLLDEDQVKVSKQLRYMKELRMVESERFSQWMIYRLADPENPLLAENLKCLQDCYNEQILFREDLENRQRLMAHVKAENPQCACAIKS
ncbi:MAG: ArsR/SmtB family transcription factor [Puniceicoccales bacterium]